MKRADPPRSPENKSLESTGVTRMSWPFGHDGLQIKRKWHEMMYMGFLRQVWLNNWIFAALRIAPGHGEPISIGESMIKCRLNSKRWQNIQTGHF
jgi:hypothetical protein